MLRQARPYLRLSLFSALVSCTPLALDMPNATPTAHQPPIQATPSSSAFTSSTLNQDNTPLTDNTQLVPLSKGGTLGQKLVPLSKGGTLGQGLVPLSKGGTLGQRLDGYVQNNRSFYVSANATTSFYVHLYDPAQRSVLASVETTSDGYFHFAQAPLQRSLLLVAINPDADTEYRAYLTPGENTYAKQNISLETTAESLIQDSALPAPQQAFWHSEAGQNQRLKLLRYLATSAPELTYLDWQQSSTLQAILRELQPTSLPSNTPPQPDIPPISATATPTLPPQPTPVPTGTTFSTGGGVIISPTPTPTPSPTPVVPQPTASPTPQPTPTPTNCSWTAVQNAPAAAFFSASSYAQVQQNYLTQLRNQAQASAAQCRYINPVGNCNSLNGNEMLCSDGGGQFTLQTQGCSQWYIEADHINLQHTPTLPIRVYTHQQISINQAFVGSVVTAGSANISLNQGQTQGLIMSSHANINLNNQARFEGVMAITGAYLPTLNLSSQAQYHGLLLLPESSPAPENWVNSPVFQNPQTGFNTAQLWSNLLQNNLCPQP